MARKSWNYYAEEAANDKGMPAKWRIVFHCFNPNGVYAELKVMNSAISKWCEDHPERPNGVLFVYGSLNDFPRKELFKALDAPLRRKNVTRDINVAINLAASAIRDGNEFLANEDRWPAPKKIEAP